MVRFPLMATGCGLAGVICLVVASLAPAAHAQADLDAAAAHYARAREAYQAQDFEAALEALELATRLDLRAVYVYNMARVLEAMGRYGEAHGQFLRVPALADATEELEALAGAGAAKLDGRHDKAVVLLEGIAEGAMVQLDDRVVIELDEEQLLPGGRHQICVTAPGGAASACWSRRLEIGLRTALPPASRAGTRGELLLPEAGLEAIAVDGHVLVADLTTLRTIEIDVGQHALTLTPRGGEPQRQAVTVLAGRRVSLALGPAVKPPGPAPPVEEPSPDPGPWPWVTAGAGAAVLIAGGALLAVAQDKRDGVTSSQKPLPPEQQRLALGATIVAGDMPADRAAWDEADAMDGAGIALVAVGGAALIGGFVWWFVAGGDSDDGGADAVEASYWVAPAGSGLAIGGTF